MRKPCLYNNEEIIMHAQGTLRLRWLWHQGNVFLTNKRLIFIQETKQVFETRLDRIIDIMLVKEVWMLGVRIKQLYIKFKYSKYEGMIFLAVVNPEKWLDMIKDGMIRMMAERWGYDGTDTESSSNIK